MYALCACGRVLMLRLWQVEGEGGAIWRASLEDARTGERRGFSSLEALVAWLRKETGCAGEDGTPPEASEGKRG